MKFWCRLGIHRWTKWISTTIKTLIISKEKEYSSEGQKRYCIYCGHKQLRTL